MAIMTPSTAPFWKMMADYSKSLTYTPVTKTTSNISGDETLTDGTPQTITGVFFRKEDIIKQSMEGLFMGADAIILVKPDVTIAKDAKITYDSQTFRINDEPLKRRLGTVHFYNYARLFKI